MNTIFSFGIVLLSLIAMLSPAVEAREPASPRDNARTTVTLENAQLRLDFTVDGDLRLISVDDKVGGGTVEFIDSVIWSIFLRDVVSGSQLNVTPDTHTSYTFGHVLNDHGTYQELIATWSNLTVDGNDELTSIVVTATLEDDAVLADMKIDVTTNLTDYSLFRILFPEFYLEPLGGDGTDDFITNPTHGGYVIDDPIQNRDPVGWPHPGWYAMQFFAYYDDSCLVYMATDDAEGYYKLFGVAGSIPDNAVLWRLENYPEYHDLPTADYAMPYNFKIGVMQGDWYDASMMYRDWAHANLVTKKPIGHPDSDFSESLRDVDAITAYSLYNTAAGLNQTVLQGMKDSKNFYGVDRMACTLYLWTIEPGMGTTWPEVTPVDNLTSGIQAMHDDGDLAYAYSQMAYDQTLPSYITYNIEDHAIKNIDGSIYYGQSLVRPDPYITWWQEFTRDWNKDLALTTGMDGSYWDFWAGVNVGDYDPDHPHPTGGGSYHAQGKREQAALTVDGVRAEPGHEDWVLSSEYVNEFYLDMTDLAMWNEDLWKDSQGKTPEIRLPMYEVIYGDREFMWTVVQTVTITEPNWDEMASYKCAAKLSIGLLLGFNGDPDIPFDPGSSPHGQAAFQFLGKLMRTQVLARKYVMWGRMLHNVQVNSVGSKGYRDIIVTDIDTTGNHWIHTASYPEISYVIPSVWGAYSEKDSERSLALMLINWHENQQTIDYTFRFDDYGLTKGRPYRLMTLDENGQHHVGVVRDDFTRVDALGGRGVKIYIIEPFVRPRPVGGKDISTTPVD
jgi:hypothetical protein